MYLREDVSYDGDAPFCFHFYVYRSLETLPKGISAKKKSATRCITQLAKMNIDPNFVELSKLQLTS